MPLVLPLVAIIVAILAILFILAAEQMSAALSQVVPDWHIPGFGSIAGWVEHAGARLASWAWRYFMEKIRPLVDLFMIGAHIIQNAWGSILNTFGALRDLAWHTIAVTIPHRIAILRGLLDYAFTHLAQALASAVAGLRALIATEVRTITALIGSRVKALVDLANYLHAQAIAYASAVRAELRALVGLAYANLTTLVGVRVAALVALANYLHAQAIAYIDSRVGMLAQELAATRASLIAYCDALVARAVSAAIGNEHVLIAKSLTAVWPHVIDSIDGVIGAAEKDFADVVADLQSIPRAIPADAATALVGTAAGVAALARLAEDCVIPNCRNLSGVGRELQALFGVIEGDLIIGLLAESARDPKGTAALAGRFLAPLVAGASDTVRSQVGA